MRGRIKVKLINFLRKIDFNEVINFAMSIFSLIAYSGDYERFIPKSELISYQEHINSTVNILECNIVGKIISEYHEHRQAYTRWLINMKFKIVTGRRFAQLANLIFKYMSMSWKKPSPYNLEYILCEYTNIHQYIPPLPSEQRWAYAERVLRMYHYLIKNIKAKCVHKKDEKALIDSTLAYFKLPDHNKKSHIAKYTRLFHEKIIS